MYRYNYLGPNSIRKPQQTSRWDLFGCLVLFRAVSGSVDYFIVFVSSFCRARNCVHHFHSLLLSGYTIIAFLFLIWPKLQINIYAQNENEKLCRKFLIPMHWACRFCGNFINSKCTLLLSVSNGQNDKVTNCSVFNSLIFRRNYHQLEYDSRLRKKRLNSNELKFVVCRHFWWACLLT